MEEKNKGLQLLKKGKRGLVQAVFSRLGIILILLIIQVFMLFGLFRWFDNLLPHFWGGSVIFSAIMVLYLINGNMNPTAKITWLIVIMMLPVFGALLYWYTQSELGHRAVRARLEDLKKQTTNLLKQNNQALKELKECSKGAAGLAAYINKTGAHPVYNNTDVKYFPNGSAKWEAMLTELEKAQEFIFLEYFIVDEGMMWGRILEILAKKAKEGVDVRVMYDGTCEFTTLPHDYPKRLKQLGIKCKMFSPVVPLLSTHYNYRDHRKILVIDGKVGFNGGVNLADEYINQKKKFGYWKDTAVMLKGEAVRSFTLMFLQMWNIDEKEPVFDKYINAGYTLTNQSDAQEAVSEKNLSQDKQHTPEGFVIPYGDCPLDDDKVGERVYMDILNRATKYVHIMTPYLILDGELETALCFAAERGVDVRLILPGIPDKKIAYSLAKTHYKTLLKSGVKIYEFVPGFVHAKVFVSDDSEAVVGTINMDYRSLYHHFECATWMYGTQCINEIEKDYQSTLSECRQVTPDTIWKDFNILKPIGHIMKILAPLM